MGILTTRPLEKNRLNVDGVTVSKQTKLNILREWFKTGTYSRKEAGKKLGITPVKAYTDYMVPLIDEGFIKKVDGTRKYAWIEKQVTKADVTEEQFKSSEWMQTTLFKNWQNNNHSKNEKKYMIRFARICAGEVNPEFRLHPDQINDNNWIDVVNNIVKALQQVTGKNRLHYNERQGIRHAIMYGLYKDKTLSISEEMGYKLQIDGEKNKPKTADLRIPREKYQELKKLLADNINNGEKGLQWFCKAGVKLWTGVRPSIIYTLKTDEPIFYDRTTKHVELNGKFYKKPEVVDALEQLLLLKPELSETIKVVTQTKRACRFEGVHEHKTDTDFNKFIFDEDFVKALEKYVQQRKFQKKRYLFWEDNATEFEFVNYDKIVKHKMDGDNEFFKKLFVQIGFKKEDFGTFFKANYGFRHFSIQLWLEETDYDYDFVQTMFHENMDTLKQWYGKPSAEYQENRAKGVIV